MRWTLIDMPAQTGGRAVVTGETGGLLETAATLAAKGADIVVATRDPVKGMAAARERPG